MRNSIIIALIILSSSPVHAKELQPLRWLPGAWLSTAKGKGTSQLFVSSLNKGRLLASEITLSKSKPKSFEHFEIRSNKGTFELEVFPHKQKPLVLKATSSSPNKIVFENPKHDFPKYWSFELMKNGTLVETAKGDNMLIEITFSKIKMK